MLYIVSPFHACLIMNCVNFSKCFSMRFLMFYFLISVFNTTDSNSADIRSRKRSLLLLLFIATYNCFLFHCIHKRKGNFISGQLKSLFYQNWKSFSLDTRRREYVWSVLYRSDFKGDLFHAGLNISFLKKIDRLYLKSVAMLMEITAFFVQIRDSINFGINFN